MSLQLGGRKICRVCGSVQCRSIPWQSVNTCSVSTDSEPGLIAAYPYMQYCISTCMYCDCGLHVWVTGVHCPTDRGSLSLYCRDTGDESLDRKPTPLPPPVQTVTTPDQTILKPPPGDQNQEDHTAPARVNSPRDAYDNINLKTSILPPELRTEENLEGRLLDLAEVRLLEEAERRKEESYEDIEMSLRRKEEAVAAVRDMAVDLARRKGEGSDDLYTNPADAIADEKEEEAVKTAAKTASFRKKRKRGKDSSEGESVSTTEYEPELYTSVFDHLPSGEREVVAHPQTKTGGRGRSKSPSPSPHGGRKNLGVGGGGEGGGKRDFCGYEDIEDDAFAHSAPAKESPLLQGGGELDDPVTPRREGNGKTELAKRYSHPAGPSRRDREAAKEMVEVNPRSRKPVTLSSGRRKGKLQRDTEEAVDGEENNDVTISKSAGSSPNKAKEFTIQSEGGDGPQDSYAMVDVSGKIRYRAESDSMKREGSGVPKHYTTKQCPPEETDDPTPVIVNT